jgi:hypothetical protein
LFAFEIGEMQFVERKSEIETRGGEGEGRVCDDE